MRESSQFFCAAWLVHLCGFAALDAKVGFNMQERENNARAVEPDQERAGNKRTAQEGLVENKIKNTKRGIIEEKK